MPHHFRPYQPDQPLLLPPDLRDWLPEDHLVYTVNELVDALHLAAFYAPYAQQGSGNLPYAPAMMVKILVYGYATAVLSSRRLAQKLEEDVAFRVLAAGNRPQHRTICEFRRRHRADFGAVLVAVVQLARDLDLVSLAILVPDRTKVRANASNRKAMSYGRMQQEEARLNAEIEALQAAAEALDTAEDAQFGMDLRGDEVPVALQRRESRRAAIQKAQAALEARAQSEAPAEPAAAPPVTPAPQSQYNFTAPESRIMKTSQDGFPQCYNAQLVVDADSQLIVTAAVNAQASDQGQLPRLLDAVQADYGHTPHQLLADAGYRNERDLQELEARGIDGYVALGREGRPASGRRPRGPATRRMQTQLETPQGHDTYAQRKWLVEAPIGWIKRILGFRQFGLRGLHPVQGEWDLVCLALNVKRLHRLLRPYARRYPHPWTPGCTRHRATPTRRTRPGSMGSAFRPVSAVRLPPPSKPRLHIFCGADSLATADQCPEAWGSPNMEPRTVLL